MAELCELESMDCQPQEGLDYDDYVAQIEFEDPSMMSLEQSAFVSMLADPGLISTDSLDMANIRARCEDTKNDYKLTFEDSGQWTTSGVFSTNTAATASPPTNAGTKRIVKLNLREEGDSINQNFSLRLLEQLNDGWSEDKRKPSPLADDLNSKKNNVNPRHFDVIEATSWRQQIKNDELYCQDEGTSSNMHSDSKEVSNNKQQSHYSKQKQCGEQIRKMPKETNGINDNGSKSRPSKLLANFLERQRLLNGHMQNNYELDNERMVDLNENEIGYAPQNNIGPIQRPGSRSIDDPRRSGTDQRVSKIMDGSSTSKSCRTFTDASSSQTTPELKFIGLSHKVPTLCRPSISLDDMLKRNNLGNCDSINEVVENCITNGSIVDDLIESNTKCESCMADPDSGLGTSISMSNGPLHIDDWPSLAALLPKNVVEAYSFFKSNSSLLTGSADNNNIDRAVFKPIGRHNLSANRHLNREECPMCLNHAATTTSEILTRELTPHIRHYSSRNCLNLQELSLIGLPFYCQKRTIVEMVIEGVAEVVRCNDGSAFLRLLNGLEQLLKDGLKSQFHSWDVVIKSTSPGPVTSKIYKKIQEINAKEKLDSRIQTFFQYLISVNSLDGWFSYIILKETVIRTFYEENAFLLKANDVYRSLFWRLIEAFGLLSIITLERSVKKMKTSHDFPSNTCLPSDSRVPKSSSMPIRSRQLTENRILELNQQRPETTCDEQHRVKMICRSRIPIWYSSRSNTRRGEHSNIVNSTQSNSTELKMGKARIETNGMFSLQKDELVRILSVRGEFAHCCRLHYRFGFVMNGKVPTKHLSIL